MSAEDVARGAHLENNEQPQDPQDFIHADDGVLGVLEKSEGGSTL